MRRTVVVLGLAVVTLLAPRTANAHFYIDYPDAEYYPGPSPVPWWHEDSFGLPQKLGPCGDEDDGTDAGGGPTNVVTHFAPGDKVTLQWTEVVSHAGWFRIALAANRDDFRDPTIAIGAGGLSVDAGIEDQPIAPVIADGIYKHPLGAVKTWPPYTITLPTTPCEKCTIQIIQVMLDHPSNLPNLPDGAVNPDGFLYHHCMDISIGSPDAATDGARPAKDAGGAGSAPDAGSGSDLDAGEMNGGGATPKSPSGCGCEMGATSSLASGALSLVGFVALLRRRRGKSHAPGSRPDLARSSKAR
jgi:MYXO-CTERM domain-containing protein